MTIFKEKKDCSGCGLCAYSCPKVAITMKQDDEGFFYPEIEQSLCIECGKCVRVCPEKQLMQYTDDDILKCFEAENICEDTRLASSSGGVFSALAENILCQGGVVVSPKYDADFRLYHNFIRKIEEIADFRGSKYTQSRIFHLYSELEEELKTGKQVLFTGTPCQTAAVKSAFGTKFDNLILQDIICHGCASEKVMHYYLDDMTKQFGSKPVNIAYRDKKNGWRDFSLVLEFENGQVFRESHQTNPFFQMHLKNVALRPSCYDCHFRKGDKAADVTLGDFWGHTDDDNKGISAIIVHSPKGENLVRAVETNLKMKPVHKDAILSKNIAYNHSLQVPKKRTRFFADKNHQITHLYYAHVRRTIYDKVFDRFKKYFGRK